MSVYLDWNATAPPRPAALAAWQDCQENGWGNPSSIHAQGQDARHRWDSAKAQLAAQLGCRPSQVVLTGSGSEANNLAIHAALHSQPAGNVVASTIDHSAILRPLAARTEHDLRLLPVDQDGRIAIASLDQLVDAETRLLCLQFANNEIGTLQDIPALVAHLRERWPTLSILCDACQGVGKVAIDLAALGVDFLSLSGHKFGAPKGVGALLSATPGPLPPLIHGGRQQQDRRSGSEDVAGAVALAAALSAALRDHQAEERRQRRLLEDTFARLQQALPELCWLGYGAPRLANTMAIAHPGLQSDSLVMRLDLEGVMVSRGSACMAARQEPSHVVQALDISAAAAASVIRVSIGHSTSDEDLATFSDAYIAIAQAMLASGA